MSFGNEKEFIDFQQSGKKGGASLMEREKFFATLERARFLKRLGFTREKRGQKLVSFEGGFIDGWYGGRNDAKRT